jgi:hypothetical protein
MGFCIMRDIRKGSGAQTAAHELRDHLISNP